MKQLRNALTHLLNGLAGLSFLAMVVLTCWQVVTRYLLQNPSSWSEELVSYLFAWMALLGASLVTSERGHMNIPVIVERMPGGLKMAFSILDVYKRQILRHGVGGGSDGGGEHSEEDEALQACLLYTSRGKFFLPFGLWDIYNRDRTADGERREFGKIPPAAAGRSERGKREMCIRDSPCCHRFRRR